MMIYKVLRTPEYQALQRSGESFGAPVDLADGYIHFSTAETLQTTLDKHFAGEDGLMLLACDPEPMGDALRWEPARGGRLFPHLYRALRLSDISCTRPIVTGPDGHDAGVLT